MSKTVKIECATSNSPVCAIDIGNSRIKLFLRDARGEPFSAGKFLALDYSHGWEAKLIQFFEGVGRGANICISSVNNNIAGILDKNLNKLPVNKITNVSELLKKQSIIDCKGIKGIGSDRILGMIGAMSANAPPFITVDCGTAVTVNAVDINAKCLGGAIFAGLETQLKGLTESAEGLSEIGLKYSPAASGKDTASAMSSGIILSIAGGIIEIVRRIAEQDFGGIQPLLFVTGGGGEIISAALRDGNFRHIIQPGLVLEGIFALYNNILSVFQPLE